MTFELGTILVELNEEDIQLANELEEVLAGGSCGLGCKGTY